MIQNEQEFEALFFKSEKERANENLLIAIEGYKQLLQYRLIKTRENGQLDFSNYDAIVIERLGDLSWLFGFFDISSQLFAALQTLCLELENYYVHAYLGIKRASLELDKGQLENAFEILQELDRYFGDIHQIPFSQLKEWEHSCNLPVKNQEQANILKLRFYYLLGGILMRLGQFEESLLSFRRAMELINENSSPMLQSMAIPLQLHICRSLLEKGEIIKAKNKLKTLQASLSKEITSGNYIHWLEISAKCKMLTGDFGKAKSHFEEIYKLCTHHNLINAQITALCNLAHINIYLNQVALANKLLDHAKQIAIEHNNKILISKIHNLKHLAKKRASSHLISSCYYSFLLKIKNT